MKKNIIVFTAITVAALVSVGCQNPAGKSKPSTTPATSINIAENKSKSLILEEKFSPRTRVLPPDTTDTLEWSSENPAKVSVNKNTGMITAVDLTGITAVRVTLKSKQHPKISDYIDIMVVDMEKPLSDLSVTPESQSLLINEKFIPALTKFPPDTTDTIEWTSADPSKVSVDQATGEITAKAVTATAVRVTAQSKETPDVEAFIEINVVAQAKPLTELIVEPEVLVLTMGENEKYTPQVLRYPDDATDTLEWTSADSAKVSVNKDTGEITARAATGNLAVRITAASKQTPSVKAYCDVSVEPLRSVPVQGVTINGSTTITFNKIGSNFIPVRRTLYANINPSDATNKTVQWSSGNTSVARVAEDGEVTPVGVGNTVITVTTNDQGKTATVNVSITELVAGALGVVNITEAEGWLETLYVKWDKVAGAERYTVEYQGTNTPSWTKIDDPLIREYDNYYRTDILGLAAGNYTVRVQPSNELEEGIAVESSSIAVTAHDRSGFAFSAESPHKTSSGAYNENGTLKAGAQVLYITAQNAKTVTLAVRESTSKTTTGVGIGKILSLRQKGYDQTPLVIRFIGMVRNEDISDQLGSNSLLQVKGKTGSNPMNTTVEGVGNDAVLHGWGILVRNAGNVEIRNLGFMMFPEDGVSLDTDNKNIWVHNCDFFYGKNGGGDKKKGDGALDSKKSGYSTFSYNHFWDSGKCNLLGNGTEPEEKLTYHHNWYDHSDSRHPRVRFHTVHVYNNYYDGVGKYGIGATSGSSIFAEANYFRNTKKPLMISMQGTDIAGGAGTFSGEDGGIIKACNNFMDAATGASSNYRPWSGSNTVEFDAYPVTNRNDTVPGTVTAKKGGKIYNNFDTASTMYNYTPDTPEAARDKVIRYAGRYWHGDFSFTFTNAMDTLVDDPMSDLQSKINAYKSGMVSIQGDGDNGGDNGGGDPGNGGNEPPPVIEGTVICTFDKDGATNKTAFTVTGSTSNSKGTVTVNGTTYNWCLKMESGTNISFTIDKTMTLYLVFGSASDPAANKNVKINGANQKVGADATLTVSLGAGTHTIQKGDTMHLFYISLSE
jgi:pectate lyase/uncharacterized protein YjdB